MNNNSINPNQENPNSTNMDVSTGGPSGAGTRRTTARQYLLTGQESRNNLPRFLVVKKKTGDFQRESPFVIDKEMREKVGVVKSVRKTREGLLVESQSDSQTKKLLDLKQFKEHDIEVTEHVSLNIVKGVVTCRDLLNCSLEEIVEQLSDQGVVEAKRIYNRRDGTLQETASLILSFRRLVLPEKIRAGIYKSLPVRLYIPAPMRCFKCQRFGHTSARCDKSPTCVCGKPIHEGSSCQEPMKCPNCEGQHSARSKHCPKFREELEIQKVKTVEKISFTEARRKVRSTNLSRPITYAQATRNTTPSIDVQEIVNKLIPEIKKVCEHVMRGSTKGLTEEFLKPQGQALKPVPSSVSARSAEAEHPSDTSSVANSASADKRKRGVLSSKSASEISDSDESALSSQTSQGMSFSTKKKRGWKKGRPRKSPAEITMQDAAQATPK